MIIHGIHHIRFAVLHPQNIAKIFIERFKFKPYAIEIGNHPAEDKSVVLKHQDVTFILCKRTENKISAANVLTNGNSTYNVDTVCDVSFKANLSSSSNKIKVEDENGYVHVKVIPSIVGNLHHTLIDVSEYNGEFLPGFKLIEEVTWQDDNYFFNIDHVAFAVHQGYTTKVLAWYKEMFKLERLFINEDDDEEDGFVVQSDNMGLKLKAMQQTKCEFSFPLKFVIAESTSSMGKHKDQINEFLFSHKGMGVQHIALGTTDIVRATKYLRDEGANFILPPIEYFMDGEKRNQILSLDLPLDDITKNGIMVESKKLCNTEDHLTKENKWYILQVFTRPIFNEETFFLELIQRYQTDAGFGAGNIEALWKSLQSHMNNNVKS